MHTVSKYAADYLLRTREWAASVWTATQTKLTDLTLSVMSKITYAM